MAVAEAKKQAKPEREPLTIRRGEAQLAEYARNQWEVRVPAGTEPDELLRPEAWGPISRELQPRDLVYVQPDDGRWLAILRVRSAWVGGAQVFILQQLAMPPLMVGSVDEGLEGFDIFVDEVQGWTIRRKADGTILGTQAKRPELSSREACRRYVLDHASMRSR